VSPIRDFLDRPIEIQGNGDEIDRALEQLLPPELRNRGTRVLISFPTTEPVGVIGSVAGPLCMACGRHVWAAPSSVRAGALGMPALCLYCVERTIRRLGRKA
jgi:hypothetical protein